MLFASLEAQSPLPLNELAAALNSGDAGVRDAAERDLLNGVYRGVPASEMLPVLLPLIETPQPDVHRRGRQGLFMEHMAVVYGPRAKAALPRLIRYVTDETAPVNLRGSAIDAAAKIGPGDESVVAALVTAIENPVPTNTTGVHDRAALRLGEMGLPGLPGRDAIRKLLSHPFDMTQDAAFIALGRLELAERRGTLAEQLAVLESPEKRSTDEVSAALLAVQESASNKDAASDIAARARRALLPVIAAGDNNAVARAALQTLVVIGPGGSPEMVAALVANLRRNTHLAADALGKVEPADKEAVRPLADGLMEFIGDSNYTARVTLARVLGRYSSNAAPAGPILIEALGGVRRITARHDAYLMEINAYLTALIAIGADTPGLAEALISRLDPEGSLMKDSGELAGEAQIPLLVALGEVGLPEDPALRRGMLERISAGLKSERPDVFSAAAGALARLDRERLGDDAAAFVQPLLRVLKLGFDFRAVEEGSGDSLSADVSAAVALGSLGPAAEDALPKLRSIAARPLTPHGSFEQDPPENSLIRAAREAVEKIAP